jgi:hypothetical protein
MEGYTELLKERDCIAAAPIFPVSNQGNQQTGLVNMFKWGRVQFVYCVGTLGTNGTVDMYLQQGNNANGSDQANIPAISGGNIAITQITAANRVGGLEVSAPQLTGQYVRGCVVDGVAASIVALIPLATDGRYPPATDYDPTNIQRITGN